jgi:hypothetical protein
VIGLAGRVGEGGFDVVGFEVREVAQDVFMRRAVREAPENIGDPNTHTPDTRTTAALVRLHRDVLEEHGEADAAISTNPFARAVTCRS